MRILTDKDYCTAAEMLDCHPAMVKAVAQVEASGSGYDKQGRLKLRFEGHKFRAFTNKTYDQSHPNVSYPYSQSRHKNHGYTAFNEAFQLDPTAALLATSWGKFQVMGFNYEDAGYETVNEMVDDYRAGEDRQLFSFVTLIKKWGLADEMQRATLADCRVIAKFYNGADYAVNRYDRKIYDWNVRFRRQGIDCSAAPEPAPETPSIIPPPSSSCQEKPSQTRTESPVRRFISRFWRW